MWLENIKLQRFEQKEKKKKYIAFIAWHIIVS